METKLKLKFFIVTTIIMLAIFIGATKVEANFEIFVGGEVTGGTVTSDTINYVPDVIDLNIKEVEFEKATRMAYNKIVEELQKQGITIKESSNLNLDVRLNMEDIRKLNVELNNNKKVVTLNYSNSNNYNNNDKVYIENKLENFKKDNRGKLKVNDIYIDIENFGTIYDSNLLETQFINQLNDNSIKTITYIGAGGLNNGFSDIADYECYLFKNDVFYATKSVTATIKVKMIIPENIENTEQSYINYALPKLQKFIDERVTGKVSLEKSNNYLYKGFIDGKYIDDILIKKENGILVNDNVYINNLRGTNIEINCTQVKNENMELELKNKGYNNIIGSYELNLVGASKLPSAIDVTFKVDKKYNGQTICVLHQKKDGTYEKFEKEVSNGEVTINVNELSPFVIGAKESNINKQDQEQKQEENKKEGEKDETPKTGTTNIINYIILGTLISTLLLIKIKKENK